MRAHQNMNQPIVVAVALDESIADVVGAASVLARALETALQPVHALPLWPFPTARRTAEEGARASAAVRDAVASHAGGSLAIAEPIVEESSAAPFIIDVARRVDAQMIVVGAGRGATVGGWLLGTVADRVTRSAQCPVFLARGGALPGPERPILCPIDLTPHSHLGLEAALRMARQLEAPLRVLTVLPQLDGKLTMDRLAEEGAKLERASREELRTLMRAHDTRDVAIEVDVSAGDATTVILDHATRASLVVLASRSFDMLGPASLGDVASRVLRRARCSVLAVRDLDAMPSVREDQISRVTTMRDRAREALEANELGRAERLLRGAATILPGFAPVHDDIATVLDRAGRTDEAARHRAVARILRGAHT
jgi:nucleotide-binding universal stress UspA family protein